MKTRLQNELPPVNILSIWRSQSLIDKILSIILIAAILGAIGTLGYLIATPSVGEKYTEFYIMDSDGKTINYPTELRVGEEGRVIVGIVNREHETMNYRVEVTIDGVKNNQTSPLELGHNEKREDIVSFIPASPGDSQKVEFLLYKNGEDEPYLKLHLWVNIKQ